MADFKSVAPVFLVSDIAETVRWYRRELDFEHHVFPPREPHHWASMWRGGVEIMLQWSPGYVKPDLQPLRRDGGVWDAYLRIAGLTELSERLCATANVMRGPMTLEYGCRELWIRDPNGYVLVLSEDVEPGAS